MNDTIFIKTDRDDFKKRETAIANICKRIANDGLTSLTQADVTLLLEEAETILAAERKYWEHIDKRNHITEAANKRGERVVALMKEIQILFKKNGIEFSKQKIGKYGFRTKGVHFILKGGFKKAKKNGPWDLGDAPSTIIIEVYSGENMQGENVIDEIVDRIRPLLIPYHHIEFPIRSHFSSIHVELDPIPQVDDSMF